MRGATIKSLKVHRRSERQFIRFFVFFVLAFVCFTFLITFIRYRQCLLKNHELKSTYEQLVEKAKELEYSKSKISPKGATGQQ